MATTLTHGRVRPDDGDKSSEWFDYLKDNIDLDDAHTHNGTNSSKLNASASTAVTASILAASWTQPGGAGTLFQQDVTCPGVIQFDTHAITFRDSTTGAIYLLSVLKLTATTYRVFINDNSITLTALYT